MQGWVFSLCFFHHHLVFPWQPPTHLPCGSGCSSALLLLVPSPLGLRYPSVPSLAPLFSPVSWPLALLTLPLSRWLKVLGWVQIPSHFHPFPLIFSPSESFSFLPEKKFPWLSETPPPAPKARHPSFPNPRGFCFWLFHSSQVLCCSRPLAGTWHPLFGWKCRDFIFQRRGSWIGFSWSWRAGMGHSQLCSGSCVT